MPVPVSEALSAYRQASAAGLAGLGPRDDSGPAFAELVGRAAEAALDAGRQSERMTTAALADKADIASVIAAVANAELTLQTVVAVRDRMIQAYQEIMRMPI